MSFVKLIETRFADPVSAINLSNEFVCIGTMMGRIAFICLKDFKKPPYLLKELSNENITGIEFIDDNTFYLSVGDEEVLKYNITLIDSQPSTNLSSIANYSEENQHKGKCDSCYTLLSKEFLLMIFLNQTSESTTKIMNVTTKLWLKRLADNNVEETSLDTTNYLVPFDFDGCTFVWIEYLSETERVIKAFNFEENFIWQYTLLEDDGHFSFVRLLPNKKLLIVRWQNICEIRLMNESFTVEKSFKNLGDEVIAVDIFHFPSKDKIEGEVKKNSSGEDGGKVKDIELEAIKVKKDDENVIITLLDVDGNINTIENDSIKTVVNLFEMPDIATEYKNKQFFSMGYPYYIKSNLDFYAFSSDHGVFVLKK